MSVACCQREKNARTDHDRPLVFSCRPSLRRRRPRFVRHQRTYGPTTTTAKPSMKERSRELSERRMDEAVVSLASGPFPADN